MRSTCPFYGARRMTAWLNTRGFHVNHKRISRLQLLMGIEAIYPNQKLNAPESEHDIYSCL